MSRPSDEEFAKAAQHAAGVYEAAFNAVIAWVKEQPDNTITYMGMASGLAKLVAMMLARITDDHERTAAASGAVATLMLNAECDYDVVLSATRTALEAASLQNAEVAGHA